MTLKNVKIYLFALLSMSFWGMSFVWIKTAFNYYPPITIIFLRLFFASIILFLTQKLFFKRDKIDRCDLKYFFLLAFFEPFCYFLGETFGMQYVSPTVGSIIISTIPLITPFFGWLFLKEKITIMNFTGLIISFTGIILIIFEKNFSVQGSLKGILLLFFAVFSTIGFAIIIKRLTKKYSTITILTAQTIIGAFYFSPFFLLFGTSSILTTTVTAELAGSLFMLTLLGSILAFMLFIPVIKDLGITKSNGFVNMIPVFTAFFSYIILKESFTLQKIIGIVIVISGLFLSQMKKGRFLQLLTARGK